MRDVANSQLQWGYPAPEPSLFRTAWVVLIATTVGATASAGVVMSLVDRSAGQSSLAAHTVAQPLRVAPPRADAPQTAQVNPQVSNQSRPMKVSGTSGDLGSAAASERRTNPPTTSSVASDEVNAVTDDTQAQGAAAPSFAASRWSVPDPPTQAKARKKQSVTPRYAWRRGVIGLSLGEHRHAWGFSGG
jgi:hypothetical protein